MGGGESGAGYLADWQGLKMPKHLDLQQFLDVLCVSPLAPPAVLEVAKRAHVMPYPPHWSEEVDAASGALYFYHGLKDEASWQHPTAEAMDEVMKLVAALVAERLNLGTLSQRIEQELARSQERAAEELAHWVGPISSGDEGGAAYYYNRSTGVSEWADPRERARFDMQVRYELLVGFLVAEERAVSARFGAEQSRPSSDLTQTLTSLASTMSSVTSILESSMVHPTDAAAAVGATTDEESSGRWARPKPVRSGLPLPPRASSSVRDGGANKALFNMPPHQQRYASDVLQQESSPESPWPSGSRAGFAPPPPPADPPPQRSIIS